MQSAIGCDPSLTACALVRGFVGVGQFDGRETFSSAPSGPLVGNRIARYLGLSERVIEYVRESRQLAGAGAPRTVIAIEGYSLGGSGKNNSGQHDIAEFGGILRWRLTEIPGVQLVEVPPLSLKQFVTGKGNATKQEMISHLSAAFGLIFSSDDEADAVACLLFAWGILERDSAQMPLTAFRRSIIAKVLNPPVKRKAKGKGKGADNAKD